MKGASSFTKLFETGQYGKLYISTHTHARGSTFRIYILPEGVTITGNITECPDAVEVYGVTGGQPGWTETYGWLHEGPWQLDFYKLVNKKKEELRVEALEKIFKEHAKEKQEEDRIRKLLEAY